ncbi:MAG: hypothetical protein WAL50_06720, partial [Kineosporiaceae bacterium]
MSRLLLALGAAAAAALLSVPLGAALLLTAISTPAVAHTIDCAPTVVATAPAPSPSSTPSTPPAIGPSAPGPADDVLEEGGLGF